MTSTYYNTGTPGTWPDPADASHVTVIPTGGSVPLPMDDVAAVVIYTLTGSGTLGTGAIAAGRVATQDITVTGATVGSEVAVGAPSTLEAGLLLYAYVSSLNTVTLRVANITASPISPAAAQTVNVRVFPA